MEAAAKEGLFWQRFLDRLDEYNPLTSSGNPVRVKCDNTAAVRFVTTDFDSFTTRLKHVDVKRSWLRQEYNAKSFDVAWIKSCEQAADGLTKLLTGEKFRTFVRQLGLSELLGPDAVSTHPERNMGVRSVTTVPSRGGVSRSEGGGVLSRGDACGNPRVRPANPGTGSPCERAASHTSATSNSGGWIERSRCSPALAPAASARVMVRQPCNAGKDQWKAPQTRVWPGPLGL